jgi:hypothetical protein
MTLDTLRRKAKDGTPVLWPRMQAYGIVLRVAKDGMWADMWWWHGPVRLHEPPVGFASWRKRQPLACLAEWEHG